MIGIFQYPTSLHLRRHGPVGYLDYRNFKPWLRDEFEFRCIYCLSRERWSHDGDDSFSTDHVKSQSAYPDLAQRYENLVYACCRCNSAKKDMEVPLNEPFGNHVFVSSHGEIEAKTKNGEVLIAICGLNRPKLIEFRRGIIELDKILKQKTGSKADRFRKRYFGYPSNLPDLSKLRPPEGNSRPEGITKSFFEREISGKLTDCY